MDEQIKMFIAGEEVVSNQEFTINEEMLSASSTILNNCYPKSWELTKDYVSNFYYPKDYSKFLLAKGNFQYSNDEFTPLEVKSKNLISFNLSGTGTGLVYNFNGSELLLNGTTSGAGQIGTTSSQPITLQAGTYTFSSKTSGTFTANGRSVAVYLRKSSDSTAILTMAQNNSYTVTNTFTLTEDTSFYIQVYTNGSGFVFNNFTIFMQIEEGSTATSYEPYNQNVYNYETNVEKEWNSIEILGNSYQEAGLEVIGKNKLCLGNMTTPEPTDLTITKENDSAIKINGTASGDKTITYTLLNGRALTNQNYTFSVRINTSLNNTINIGLPQSVNFHSLDILSGHSLGYTISNGESGKVYTTININITSGTTFSNTIIYFQLEQGNGVTDFEPFDITYQKPSPVNPSDIVSVGYQNLNFMPYKDGTSKTTNTLNFTVDNEGKVVVNGTPTANSYFYFHTHDATPYLNIPKGIYTLSGCASGGASNKYYLSLRLYKDMTYLAGFYDYGNGVTIDTRSYDYNRVFIFINVNSGVECNNLIFSPQLVKGQQVLPFIPYNKYGIELKNTGKNLIDISQTKIGVAWNNGSNNARAVVYMKCQPSTKYTISFDSISGIDGMYNFEKANITDTTAIVGVSQITATKTVTTNASTNYLGIQFNKSNITLDDIKNIKLQVENGTQATAYEPYTSNSQLYLLDEPLRAIGNYKDRLYIQNGSLYIERNIGKIILDGSEANWVKSGNTSFDRYILGVNIGGIVSAGGYSNYFKMINANIPSNLYEMSNNGNSQLVFNYAPYNTTNLTWFKNWLSNNNVEVNYVLSTPTTEELGAVNLPSSYEGINNVYCDSGIINGRLSLNYYWKNYDVLFAGIVKNSGDISLNPRYPHYCSLQILDYKTFLSESDTLDFVISEKTIAEAIEMVVNSVSDYGFVIGNINISQANDMIGAYSTLNKTAYDVLQYLANISGSRWRARFIDENTMAIDFYDPDLLPQASDIEYTKQYWEDNNIVDLTFNYGTRDYRNKQIVLSDEVYASISYTEVVLSNGYNTNFITQQNVGIVTSVTVNGVEKDVISQKEKELGADADFYYTPGKNVVESANSYTAGTQIAITYIPLVKGRQIVYNDEEVTRIALQTNTSGVISRYESRNDIVSSQELEQIGETYIEYKGKAELILTLTTEDKDLFNIGEITYFNAPINELQQTYMVKTKKTQYIISGEQRKLFYIYELTSSFNSEKAINYFDNQRNKAQGNIQEGESITRNIDINNSAVIIWDNPTITEVSITITGDNVLNSVLNSPFIE